MKNLIIRSCLAVLILAAASCGKAETDNSIQAVDLGLSVKWATCNLGAVYEYEKGNAFAWGDTKPEDEKTIEKSWDTYIFFKSKRKDRKSVV